MADEVLIIDDDAGEDAIFDDGTVVAGVVHESLPGRWAEHANGFWSRAKAGFEKGKAEHEAGNRLFGGSMPDGEHDGADYEIDVDGVEIDIEGGAEVHNVKVGAWERLASIPQTVAGVVGYRTTGSPHPSAGLLVKEERVEVTVPKPRPIPELMHNATDEVSGLVRAEIALVKTEIKQKAKIIGPAIGLLVAAIALLLFALPFILWAAVFALGLVLPLWASALIVFAVLLLLAAGLAFAGIKLLKKLGNIKSLAGGSIKDDIHAIIEAFKGHKWADAQAAIKGERL